MKCTGDGGCLNQLEDYSYPCPPNKYCEHKCQAIKCKNYKYCYNRQPKWVSEIQTCGTICHSCDVEFGMELSFIKGKSECHICAENIELSVVYPNCNKEHNMCIKCFNTILHGYDCIHDEGDSEEECLMETCTCFCDSCKQKRDENIFNDNCPFCRREHVPEWLHN